MKEKSRERYKLVTRRKRQDYWVWKKKISRIGKLIWKKTLKVNNIRFNKREFHNQLT